MTITVLEASNYFRGLLLLIRKDLKTSQAEIALMKRIGKTLGFEEEFCETAIDEILENIHIVDEVPCFSNRALAEKFVKDGMTLAFADGIADPHEEQWLKLAAEKNGLDYLFFSQEWKNAQEKREPAVRLEVEGLTVKHF